MAKQLNPMTTLPDEAGYPYRLLKEFGSLVHNTKKAVDGEMGSRKRCMQNSIQYAESHRDVAMWAGLLFLQRQRECAGICGIWHCWNTESGDPTQPSAVIDVTTPPSTEYSYAYFGIPIPVDVARHVCETASHGNELLDCWRSAAANSTHDTVADWKCRIESLLKAPTIAQVHALYPKKYRPPAVCLTHGPEGAMTIVAHNEGDDNHFDTVKTLATQRDPVNLAMHRPCTQHEVESLLGYKESAYVQMYKKLNKQLEGTPSKDKNKIGRLRLPTNFAVAATVTVKIGSNVLSTLIKVISMIGLAFDHEDQPDWKYIQENYDSDPARKDAIKSWYRRMWELAFAYADAQEDVDTLVVYGVGGGSFRHTGLYRSEDDFVSQVQQPALQELHKMYPDLSVVVGGKDNEFCIPSVLLPGTARTGAARENLLRRCLFVNAWDPHSVPGNGHGADDSLDGQWGRISNISRVAWPVTNPNIKCFLVDSRLSTE